MWSLRLSEEDGFYLTFDRERWHNNPRGTWILIGPQDVSYTHKAVKANLSAGLLCANDDEGNVRALVLED
jgi:hypothetical protein